ncbi:ABC transporter, ATPbinding domain containing protein [Balamuthia mandrillaris]
MTGTNKVNGFSKWWTQFRLLMWKNWLLTKRNKKSFLVQIAAPFILVFMLWVMEKAIISSQDDNFFEVIRSYNREPAGHIPRCVTGDPGYCYTFVYAPANDTEVETIIRNIREQNDPPIPESEVRGFADSTEVDDFIYNHLNTTQGAYIFDFVEETPGVRTLSYILQVNETNQRRQGRLIEYTTYLQIPMDVAVQRQLFRLATNNPDLQWDVDLVEFPHREVETIDIIAAGGPLFFFGALMFNFVVGLTQIVIEKEQRLRLFMNIMGLMDSVFWASWFLVQSLYSTLTVFILIISALIFDFDFFIKNDFGTYFLLMWLFALTLIPFSFLISTLVRRAKQATSIGFFVFVSGFIFQLVAEFIYSDSTPALVQYILAFFSPVIFTKGLKDLGTYSDEEADDGLAFSEVDDYTNDFPLSTIYGWLLLDFVIYWVLALYLDNVVPTEYGIRRPLHYFVTPSYWTGKMDPSDDGIGPVSEPDPSTMDADVYKTEMSVRNGQTPETAAVRVVNLNKTYGSSRKGGCCSCCNCCACSCCCSCFCGKKVHPYTAVSNVWYYIDSNQLFCLLGPNGAGKTTTISMLTGLLPPTHGNAYIYGNSIIHQMTNIQKVMGVCPQFDVLWDELTGKEHLHIFAGLKGIPGWKNMRAEARRRLEDVSLTSARNKLTHMYSGGMKRRLSVAIGSFSLCLSLFSLLLLLTVLIILALIGNPKIVFLDEPTTGMDPVSRRQVWNIIERAKKGRVVVLTTHSMEEADILGDTIAIMARGRLRCIGSSIRLKQKFGAGYRVTVCTEEGNEQPVIDFFTQHLEGTVLESEPVSGYMTFNIPRDLSEALPDFFEELESHYDDLSISDLQLSLTTLEEVFLKIAKDAEKEAGYDSDEDEASQDNETWIERAADKKGLLGRLLHRKKRKEKMEEATELKTAADLGITERKRREEGKPGSTSASSSSEEESEEEEAEGLSRSESSSEEDSDE